MTPESSRRRLHPELVAGRKTGRFCTRFDGHQVRHAYADKDVIILEMLRLPMSEVRRMTSTRGPTLRGDACEARSKDPDLKRFRTGPANP